MVDADQPTSYRLPLIIAPPLPDEPASMPMATPVTVAPAPVAAPPVEPQLEMPELPPQAEWQFQQAPTADFTAPAGPLFGQPVEPPGAGATTAKPVSELTTLLLPSVQRGYKLAQRGAVFAARTEFVQVLRRVAQAKDTAENVDTHSKALATGLRALDEASDFMPEGIQLEAELDVRAVSSSHRTAVLRDHPKEVLPHEAVTLYHDYARDRLSTAAGGEQAGSMALYGMGKVYTRLAERHDDDAENLSSAMTMYAATLATCPENYLAANELGVMLCRAGKVDEAVLKFRKTIDAAPTATAYHNLAVAQQKLGLHHDASANEQQSQRLAAWERSAGSVSRRAQIQWVTPEEMSGIGQPAQAENSATSAASRPTQLPTVDHSVTPSGFPGQPGSRAQLE